MTAQHRAGGQGIGIGMGMGIGRQSSRGDALPSASASAWPSAGAWQENAKKSAAAQGTSTPLPSQNIGFTSGPAA